jgi:hypothetical protein
MNSYFLNIILSIEIYGKYKENPIYYHGGIKTAILSKVPEMGAFVHSGVREFLEWEEKKIVNAQLVAVELIKHEMVSK